MNSLEGKRIAVLMGGPGSEREVSLASGAGVSRALRDAGADAIEVEVHDESFGLPEDILVAFNVIHGTFGEDGRLQRLLEERRVPYTGEGVAGSELAFDKIATKRRLLERNVPTAEFEVLRAGESPSLPLPYVVKASREGSSVGVYIVKTEEERDKALREVLAYGDEFLVERFVSGLELTVGVLGDQALPIIQICPKEGFYDFKNKYPFLNPSAGGAADHLCPAPLEPAMTEKVQAVALAAHRALDLETYSRVDVLVSEQGEPWVLEINTIPGMTQASLLPEAASVAGISFPKLCERIVELSLARHRA